MMLDLMETFVSLSIRIPIFLFLGKFLHFSCAASKDHNINFHVF
jgi:hypothetical protein